MCSGRVYGGATFNLAASGTTRIQVVKATVGDHGTSTGWADALGDGPASFSGDIQFTTPHYVFDGVVGGGPGSWTSGHGFIISGSGVGISVNPGFSGSGSHITIRHVEIDGKATEPGRGDGIFAVLTAAIEVSYLYIHDTQNVPFQINSVDGLTVEFTYTGFFESSPEVHAEICSCDGIENAVFRYNLFTYAASTGGLILHTKGSGGVNIHGNVFYQPSGGPAWTYGPNGLIGGWTTDNNLVDVKVFHNTFIGIDVGQCVFGSLAKGTVSTEVRNNYFYNVDDDTCLGGGDWSTVTHNHWNDSGSTVGPNATSSSGDPFVDYVGLDFRLKANPTAGTTLGTPYDVDMLGTTRATWTRGAVEFVAP